MARESLHRLDFCAPLPEGPHGKRLDSREERTRKYLAKFVCLDREMETIERKLEGVLAVLEIDEDYLNELSEIGLGVVREDTRNSVLRLSKSLLRKVGPVTVSLADGEDIIITENDISDEETAIFFPEDLATFQQMFSFSI